MRTVVVTGRRPGILPVVVAPVAGVEIPKQRHWSLPNQRKWRQPWKATADLSLGADPTLKPCLFSVSGKRFVGDEV